MWDKAEDFVCKVQDSWQHNVNGVAMHKVVCKLMYLKRSLKALHRYKFANIENDAMLALTKLNNIHVPRPEEMVRKEYDEVKSTRMSLLKKKLSRIGLMEEMKILLTFMLV